MLAWATRLVLHHILCIFVIFYLESFGLAHPGFIINFTLRLFWRFHWVNEGNLFWFRFDQSARDAELWFFCLDLDSGWALIVFLDSISTIGFILLVILLFLFQLRTQLYFSYRFISCSSHFKYLTSKSTKFMNLVSFFY